MARAKERKREKRKKRRKKNRVWEKKSFIETVEVIVRWRTEERALGREMERGSWRYLTFNNLPNSLEYATTSPTRLVFKWYSAVPTITLPRPCSSLSIGKEKKEGEEKQTHKTLDEFLIVVVRSLYVISRKVGKRELTVFFNAN